MEGATILISLPPSIWDTFSPQAPAGMSIGWEGDAAGTYFTDDTTLAALPAQFEIDIRAALAAAPGGTVLVPVPTDPGDAPSDLLPRLEALEAASHAMPDLSPIGAELTALRKALRRLARRVIALEKDDEGGDSDEDKKRKPKRKRGR